MRILYVVPRYWPSVGGAQIHTRELVQRIAAAHDVRVVTQFTHDGETFHEALVNSRPGRYTDGKIVIERVGPEGPLRRLLQSLARVYGRLRPLNPLFALLLDAAIRPAIANLVSETQADVVHAVHVGLVYSSETAYAVAHRLGRPFVWTPLPHIEGYGWSGARFRKLYAASDALVAMTHREREWLVEMGAPTSRVHVIPVGPVLSDDRDGPGFRQRNGLGQSPVILFLGQKLPYKGYAQIVEAAPSVWSEAPDARFVFIGPRTPESVALFGRVTDPRIIELPAVDLREKTSALDACDIFCMPSTQESLGGVFLEAWTLRKPVVAADIAIAHEVIDDGRDGLLVPQQPVRIAEALIRLLTDSAGRQAMGSAGFAKVQARYRWEALAEQMVAVYEGVRR